MRNERLSIPIDLQKVVSSEVRRDVFGTILNAESGHLGGCSSSVELLVSLYTGGHLKFDPKNPSSKNRDIVMIRGHEGPLRYKIFSMLGMIEEKELSSYRRLGSMLQGHEDMDKTPGVDITPSGSLGMVLSYGVGAALSFKNKSENRRAFVFLGDGEEQEGSVSEAARHAASLGLNNLICILDKNKKQLSRPTNDVDGGSNIKKIWEGYGWKVLEIQDGHDLVEINDVFSQIENLCDKPIMIIANTIKGLGLQGAEDHFSGYHTISTCERSIIKEGIKTQQKLIDSSDITEAEINNLLVKNINTISLDEKEKRNEKPSFNVDIQVDPENSTNLDQSQITYFNALKNLLLEVDSPELYVITPDFIRKDIVDLVKFNEFSQYIDVGIREQHALAMSHGISVMNPGTRIFINYGDAFIYRASDQINAICQSGSRMILMSEFSGLTQEKNGKTHQSSGQPTAIFSIPGSYFFEPADVQDLFNILNWSLTNNPGFVYLRSHRANINPLERGVSDKKNIDNYVVFDDSSKPDHIIAASGYVVSEAVEAAKKLKSEGYSVRVINLVNHKSVDDKFVELLCDGVPVLTAYNGSPNHLKSIISSAILGTKGNRPSIIKGIGFEFGTSGSFKDLLKHYSLDSDGIKNVSLSMLSK